MSHNIDRVRVRFSADSVDIGLDLGDRIYKGSSATVSVGRYIDSAAEGTETVGKRCPRAGTIERAMKCDNRNGVSEVPRRWTRIW
ncbi:hypothetical protein JCM7447_11220 [Corynebacterium amycolatum]